MKQIYTYIGHILTGDNILKLHGSKKVKINETICYFYSCGNWQSNLVRGRYSLADNLRRQRTIMGKALQNEEEELVTLYPYSGVRERWLVFSANSCFIRWYFHLRPISKLNIETFSLIGTEICLLGDSKSCQFDNQN